MKEVSVKHFINSTQEQIAKEYAELLMARTTHASMSLEKDLGNVDDSKNAIRFRDMMRAFKYLLTQLKLDKDISEEMILKIADMVNEDSPYVSRGYRKIGGKYLAFTEIPIAEVSEIPERMEELLAMYKELVDDKTIDVFEREAAFHLNFIKIHPFEDGNGRVGRLLLDYNLLKEGVAPVIITDDLVEYYHSYIKNDDIESLANLFSIQSRREQEVINKIAKPSFYDNSDDYEELLEEDMKIR